MIKSSDVQYIAIRAQGAGGQNVNKVSSAIHLRFDIHQSSLSDANKQSLLALKDDRISLDGVITIKAQNYRSQLKNKKDAMNRLEQLVNAAVTPKKRRISTKPSLSSRHKRTDNKVKRGLTKKSRNKPSLLY